MYMANEHAGQAALSVCEALLLAVSDHGVLPEHESSGILRDVAAMHENAVGRETEAIDLRAIADTIKAIIAGGSVGRGRTGATGSGVPTPSSTRPCTKKGKDERFCRSQKIRNIRRLARHEGSWGIDVIKMADGTTGMCATFEPGWTWKQDEKPSLGSPDSCPMRHKVYWISGSLVVRMVETEIETPISAVDVFGISPGHDGFVPGRSVSG